MDVRSRAEDPHLKRVRPDIIRVVPTNGCQRRAINRTAPCSSSLLLIGAPDYGSLTSKRLAKRRQHISGLAYYGMTLAAWLDHHGYADRFLVLAEAAIWPGKHDASAIRQLEMDDAAITSSTAILTGISRPWKRIWRPCRPRLSWIVSPAF